MGQPKGKNYKIRNREDIKAKLLRQCTLNEETGEINFGTLKAYIRLRFEFGNEKLTLGYHQLVWFLKHKRWPLDNMVIDHINDIPYDNRPDNLQEITAIANQNKKRGKYVNHRFGKGKYGHGIVISTDRTLSGKSRAKKINVYIARSKLDSHEHAGKKVRIGRFYTIKEAEEFIARYIENGLEISANSSIFDDLLGD